MDAVTSDTEASRGLLWRVPLVPAAGALVAGIAAGRFAPYPTGFWVALGGAGLLAAGITFARKRLHLATALAVAVTIGAIGAVHVRLAYFSVAADHIVRYTDVRPILATLRGQVVTFPQTVADPSPRRMSYRRPPQTGFILRCQAIRTRDGWSDASGQVRVTVQEPVDRLGAGRRVELVGWLGRIGGPANPGQYDWAQAGRNKGLRVRMTVASADGVTVRADGPMPAWRRALWHLRAAARQHWVACDDRRSGQLVNALVVGERHPALQALSRVMVRAGVAHFLSISGLHLGVFLGFVYLLCRLVMLSQRRSAGVVLVVLAAYLLLAEPRAPLLRSALMAAILCTAAILHRRYVALNGLAAAAIVLLAIEPLGLLQPGFQLSFAIVGGLVVLHSPVRRLLFARQLRVRGLIVFRTDQRLRRWLHYTAGNWLMDGVTMSLTAYLVAAPLVAYHFGIFSPYAPALSLLLLPLVMAVLVPGYVSMALAWPMPNLSYAFGRLAGQAADGLATVVEWLAKLPGLSFPLRPVPVAWVLLCYGVIWLVVARRRVRRGWVWATAGAAVLVAATVWTQWPAPRPDVAELNVLAVGAGQCVVLRTPSGQTYLLDAGTMSGLDPYAAVLGPFLRRQSLPSPATAFVSHANADHYNALPAVLRQGRLRRVYLHDRFDSGDDVAPPVAELMGQFARRRVEIRRLGAGMTVELDERTTVEVLWPKRTGDLDALSANDTSLVLRIRCDGQSVLLTGDIEQLPQAALVASGRDLRADVLVLPHHGTWETSLPSFVAAVDPRIVIVSGPRDPAARHDADGEPARFYRRLRTGRQ